jgi:hypothetical protein
MHTSSKPFVSTSADEEQTVALQNVAVPHILGLDKVLMEVSRICRVPVGGLWSTWPGMTMFGLIWSGLAIEWRRSRASHIDLA